MGIQCVITSHKISTGRPLLAILLVDIQSLPVSSEEYPLADAIPVTVIDDDTVERPPPVSPSYQASWTAAQQTSIASIPAPSTNEYATATAMHIHRHYTRYISDYIGRNPVVVVCPYCETQTTTRIRNYANAGTWFIACLLGCLCWPACFCFFPFACRCCQQTDHYCTRCHQKISEVRPFTC